ncbi:hypothetical protein ACTA71_006064 [Dictyostelium dimigraforme]
MIGEKRKRIELINLQEALKGRKRNVTKITKVKKTKSKSTTTKGQSKKAVGGVSKKATKNTISTSVNQLGKEGDNFRNCENYELEKDFKLNGSAIFLKDSIFQITPASSGQVGSVWSTKQVTIGNGFECEFKFNISMYRADGLAFVLQTKSNSELKRGGGELGYNEMENGLIAIEIDTFHNSIYNDPVSNHLSIQGVDPFNRLSTDHKYSLGCYPFKSSVNNGTDKHVKIIYNSTLQAITIIYDGETILKNIKTQKPLPGNAYFGFTASTGCDFQIHSSTNGEDELELGFDMERD